MKNQLPEISGCQLEILLQSDTQVLLHIIRSFDGAYIDLPLPKILIDDQEWDTQAFALQSIDAFMPPPDP